MPAEPVVAARADCVRALTFNVLSYDGIEPGQRRRAAAARLGCERADVVALQETTLGAGTGEARELLGADYRVLEPPARAADRVGSVLASRWPVRLVTEIDLAVLPRVPSAAALAACVELPDPFGPALVIHLHAAFQYGFAAERERQALTRARRIEQLAGPYQHVIVLGDFNDDPESASVRFWTGRQSLDGFSVHYQDAWPAAHPRLPGHTFTPANPLVRAGQLPFERGRRIDYILIRSGPYGPSLAVAHSRLVLDQPVAGIWASDHCGVLADLTLPAHPPGTWA
jgi:endonuclease/exonuclease/phosphatase family metal-dependent hydrolase